MFRIFLMVVCLSALIFVGTVQAAPLTEFDTYRGSVDFGLWKTDASFSDIPDPKGNWWDAPFPFNNANSADFPAEWRLSGDITYGIGGPWGLQYKYHGMASGEAAFEQNIDDPYKGSTNEFNVIYSLRKGVALFAGVNRVYSELDASNQFHNWSLKGTQTVAQGGIIARAPLSNRLDAYGLVGVGGHGLFQAGTGVALKMGKEWEANLGYRWFRMNDAFDRWSIDSHQVGVGSMGTVKVDGIQFGLTHYFGAVSKKAPRPIIPPQQPPMKIVLKGVNFDFDKDTLQPQGYPVLDQVVDVAKKHPNWDFVLIGHTDGIGSDEYNMDLSMRRVKTVQRYLISKGVAADCLQIDWKGKRESIATNATSEGRAQNRRVELHVQ